MSQPSFTCWGGRGDLSLGPLVQAGGHERDGVLFVLSILHGKSKSCLGWTRGTWVPRYTEEAPLQRRLVAACTRLLTSTIQLSVWF